MADLNKEKTSMSSAPEVAIRTMDSDIKAIKQGGGEAGPAEIFNVPQAEPEELKSNNDFNIPGYTGPEEPIFASVSSVIPNSASSVLSKKPRSGWWRIGAIVIGILILCAVFGLLGYYVISPWLFPKQMPAV